MNHGEVVRVARRRWWATNSTAEEWVDDAGWTVTWPELCRLHGGVPRPVYATPPDNWGSL